MYRLKTVGSVLYIAAHPDDENTRLISYLTNGKHLRTGYLSLTRGDGGQNLIGTEQGEALGLIRTQELLAARRIDGAKQYFTRANDFGFSKNPEETFTIWNKDSILSDMVWVIRNFKPDVIICRFPTTGEGGHGHHTASAILAEEAFDAAADATRFPEQLKYVSTWQTKRMFWNTFNFGGNNTTSPDQLKIDVGGFNPLLGKNYGEIASASRTMHKSQGFGTAMQRGENIEYFKFIKGDLNPKEDLFEGLDFSWNRFPETKKTDKVLQKIIVTYDVKHPEKSAEKLIMLYNQLSQIESDDNTFIHWRGLKLYECQELIVQCAGIWAEATVSDYDVAPGDKIGVKMELIVRNPIEVSLGHTDFFMKHKDKGHSSAENVKLIHNQLMTFTDTIDIASGKPYSVPYWLKNNHSIAMYELESQRELSYPENKPTVFAKIDFLIHPNYPFSLYRPYFYKKTDPVKGETYRPLEILPPATINLSSDVLIFGNTNSQDIEFKIVANKDNLDGTLEIQLPQGWKLEMESKKFHLAKKHDEIFLKGKLIPLGTPGTELLKASIQINGETYDKSITRIEYDHIPYQFFLHDATAKLVQLDLKIAKEKIAYIPGAGDKVAELLTQIGYHVTILPAEDLEKSDLTSFDAIITGVRAYNVSPKLLASYEKLMSYVEKGGNLIVQYNTNNRLAPLNEKMGPYPFKITAKRVTDERAKVNFSNPQAPVLNNPNKITSQDFEGWVQERGLYFADEIDARYETVFTMNDQGEQPLNGSLIIGKYGKGYFVYTGLAFFRELPAGVSGAYRLLANIIGLGSVAK
jgi:LmbE family N-acetylglucosaminyl deacetylase